MNFPKVLLVIFSVFLIFTLLNHPAEAKVYKWKDENGKTHFTNDPSNIPFKDLLEINKNKKKYFSSATNLICEKPLTPESEAYVVESRKSIKTAMNKIKIVDVKSRKSIETHMNEIKILEGELSNSNSHFVRKSLNSMIDTHHELLHLVRKNLKTEIEFNRSIIHMDELIIESATRYNRCIEKQDY